MDTQWRQTKLGRRHFVAGTGAIMAAGALARPALAAPKPDKLVFMIDNAPWHGTMIEDAAPAFEKETGIHIEFTKLPDDALIARLKAELSAGSSNIDITQFGATWGSFLRPHLEDVTQLMASATGPHAENFAFDDIPPSIRKIAIYDDKLLGIPYRVTMGVLHYQPEVLKQAGFDKPPANWDEFRETAIAVTKNGGGKRYGFGTCLRQGPAINSHFESFLLSNKGSFYDPKTREIHINNTAAVEALAYYGALATKDKVIPPDAVTWEWDEIIANGQADRYAMAVTFGASGSMLNNPAISKTGGRWAATVAPGHHGPDESRTFLSGWSIGIPTYSKNKEYAFAFAQMICSREWAKRSLEKGNCPGRISVLKDPDVAREFYWAPAAATALLTGQTDPQEPIWGALDLPLRTGVSRVVTGETDAKSSLDTVASNWQRIMRRGAAL